MLINLSRRLQLWREHDLLSDDDVRRILDFENSQNRRSWVSFGIAGIGVTALVTGVISIIASNWEDLGDAVKLSSYFVLQTAIGVIFLRYERQKGVVREVSLAIFALLLWAGIGLFAQVYNLSGAWWQAMLFWVCITTPATLYSNSWALCSLWCVTLVATSAMWCGETLSQLPELTKAGFVVTTAVLLTAFGIGSHALRIVRDVFRDASIRWGIGFLLLVATPMINIHWSDGYHDYLPQSFASSLIVPWFAFAVAILVSLRRPGVDPLTRKASALLFAVSAMYLSSPFIISRQAVPVGWIRDLCGATGFIAVWVAAAAAAASANMKRLFEIASFVIAARFVVIYFEVFGSLSTTGIGLIISGAVIIGIGILWNRGRRTISSKLGGRL